MYVAGMRFGRADSGNLENLPEGQDPGSKPGT